MLWKRNGMLWDNPVMPLFSLFLRQFVCTNEDPMDENGLERVSLSTIALAAMFFGSGSQTADILANALGDLTVVPILIGSIFA